MKSILKSLIHYMQTAYHKKDPETDIAWQRLKINLNNQPIIQENRIIYFGAKWFRRPVPAISLLILILILLISPFAYNSWSTFTVTTQYGTQQQLSLPDGSTVYLNSGSTLSYKRNYNEKNRAVIFRGEALFTVLPSSHPFIIESENLKIEVVGTAFNVKNYSDEIEVAVMHGTVLVNQFDSTVTVTKGELTRFEQNQRPSTPEPILYDNYPGWIHKTLIYEKTELTRVCDEIERIFNIQIKLNNPKMESITVTGTIKADNLDVALTILSFLIQKRYKYKNDYYVIY